MKERTSAENFEAWWNIIGSGIIPGENMDAYEHAKNVAFCAWLEAEKHTDQTKEIKNDQ